LGIEGTVRAEFTSPVALCFRRSLARMQNAVYLLRFDSISELAPSPYPLPEGRGEVGAAAPVPSPPRREGGPKGRVRGLPSLALMLQAFPCCRGPAVAIAPGRDHRCHLARRPRTSPPSFLCLSQESSAPMSMGAGDFYQDGDSFTAQTRRGWIPVTSTGMREVEEASPIPDRPRWLNGKRHFPR